MKGLAGPKDCRIHLLVGPSVWQTLVLLGFVFLEGAGIVDNAVGRDVKDSRRQRRNKAVIVRNK